MQEKINEKVGVVTIYDNIKRITTPYAIKWQGKTHKISKIGYHHTQREGRTLMHIFSVSNDSLAFRLKLDTDTLNWTLEAVSDGNAN